MEVITSEDEEGIHMTRTERLLALDAALAAAECNGNPEVETAILKLQKLLDKELQSEGIPFGEFILMETAAVSKLAENPQTFGGEPRGVRHAG